MTSPTIDRRLGLIGNTAWKAPVTALAAANVTLSGEQTIDGVALLEINSAGVPDRVLCIAQNDSTENGIWDVSTGAWTRSLDANGNYDLAKGTNVLVVSGTVYSGSFWQITAANPITIGTTSMTWGRSLANSATTMSFVQSGTGAETRTAQDKMRDKVDVADYDTLRNALATGKRVTVPATTTSISVAAADSPYVLPYLRLIDAEGPLALSLAAGVHTTTTGDIGTVGANENVTLEGAAVVSTTITSVASVTGSLGNWAVTFNVADATGIAAGNVLKVDSITPGAPNAASGAAVPVLGQLYVGFNRHGSITTTAGADTFTLSGTGANNSIAVGDLIHVQGQTREVATIGSNSGTVTANWDLSVAAYQWWYYSKAEAGTLEISGTTVTGTTTAFDTRADPGDLLLVSGMMLKIASVVDATGATVTVSKTVASGAKFTIVKAGVLHEGSFVVTNVVGNAVTVTNRSRFGKPPALGISGGTAVAIQTVLKNTGTGNGLVFGYGSTLGKITRIALQGNGSATAGTGLALNGTGETYNQANGTVFLDDHCAVLEWDRGAFLAGGAVLVATGQHICNNFDTGVECGDGGNAYLRSAVVSHNNDIGLFVGGGSYARISGAKFCGNALQGVREDVGASVYGDQPGAWGNGSHGLMLVNACGVQFADGFSCANDGSGANFQNGAAGRVSRTLFAGNTQHALSVTNGKVEATQAWFTGSPSGQSGLVASKSEVDILNAAATGNGAQGIYAFNNSRVDAKSTFKTLNGTVGIRADDFSEVLATGGYNTGNTSGDISQTAGGVITTDLNSLGNHAQGSHFRQITTIADDAATSIYVGNNTVMLGVVSASESTLWGLVRARCGSSASVALMLTAASTNDIRTATGALTGTTGSDGYFTASPSTDGYLYLENRRGASRQITIDIMGSIT